LPLVSSGFNISIKQTINHARGKEKKHPFSGVERFGDLLFCIVVPSSTNYRAVLGAAIRKHRKRVKLSQEKLAEKADLHPNYLGRVERGEEHISLAALRRIAHALKTRVAELVKDI
jgi:DNA-binding XRE family transcriptional regulator